MTELWLDSETGEQSIRVNADGGAFTIGRNAVANLVLHDMSDSRDHAHIELSEDGYILIPRSLRQPTIVNGIAHDRPVQLTHGDLLTFGSIGVRVRMTGGESAVSGGVRSTESGKLFRSGDTVAGGSIDPIYEASKISSSVPIINSLVIGRRVGNDTNQLALEHSSVSARHAVLLSDKGALSVRDLGSTNGTFVNDQLVAGTLALADDDLIRIGPYVFKVRSNSLEPVYSEHKAALTVANVSVSVNNKGSGVLLLSDVSVQLRQGEFTAIVGPSGCGKSTLLRVMSGRMQPTDGAVYWKASDLHHNFSTLRSDITFVPQREVLPELLSVREALLYTAQLRLPSDTTASERERIVDEVIETVGLSAQADTRISLLSGGQRKRTGLANELIVSPSIIFLDEVTSGLDDAADAEFMALFRQLADRGMIVVCVTHTLAHVEEFCDALVVMARGGRVAYHGPSDGLKSHFGITQLGQIYDVVKHAPSEMLKREGSLSSPYHDRVNGLQGAPSASSTTARRTDKRVPFAQFPTLLRRSARISLADQRTLMTSGAQGLVIALLLRVIFGGDALGVLQQQQLVFLVGICAFWFGCNNAARELVKERSLFRHEIDVNLRMPSYLAAKMLLVFIIGIVQCGLLLGTALALGLHLENLSALATLVALTVLAGTSCGFVISAASSSEDQAGSLVPIVLIPQLLLAGAIVTPLNDLSTSIARGFVSAYWMFASAQESVLHVPINVSQPQQTLLLHSLLYTAITVVLIMNNERRRRNINRG